MRTSKKEAIRREAVVFVEDAVARGREDDADTFLNDKAEEFERLGIDAAAIRRHADRLLRNRLRFDRPSDPVRARVVRGQLDDLDHLPKHAPWATREDLERAGNEGFTEALRHFDTDLDETEFEPIARTTVRAAMLSEEAVLVPAPLRRPRRAIARSIKNAASRFVEAALSHGATAPPAAAVAAGLGVSVDDLEGAYVDLDRITLQAAWLKKNRDTFDQGDLRERVKRAQFRRFARAGWLVDDLSADIGFENALRGFDPESDKPFEPYAHGVVRHALLAEANEGFPRSLRDQLRAIREAERAVQTQTGRAPTIEEIGHKAGLDRTQIVAAWAGAALRRPDQSPDDAGERLEARTMDAPGPADDREWIERGISGPRGVNTDQVTLEGIKRAVAALPGGQAEVCRWLEGTWDYLARISQRRPSESDLAAALRISSTVAVGAFGVMGNLLAMREIPRIHPDPGPDEFPEPGKYPEEVAEAFESLSATQRAILNWNLFGGPAPDEVVDIGRRTARTRINEAIKRDQAEGSDGEDRLLLYWRDAGVRESQSALASHVPVGLPDGPGQSSTEADEVQKIIDGLVNRAVKSSVGVHVGPTSLEEERATRILTRAIDNTIKQRIKRARDAFGGRTVLNVVEMNLTVAERDRIINRYRDGQHRIDLEHLSHDTYRTLYGRLREALKRTSLLTRIFSDGVLEVLDSRYLPRRPVPSTRVAANGWSVNRRLALEFEKMQEIMTVIAPLGEPNRKREELPHALLPVHLVNARLRFHEDLPADTVATLLNKDVTDVYGELRDVIETERWLFDEGRPHGRFLNMGPYQPANDRARAEFAAVCDSTADWPAAERLMSPLSRRAVCSILGFK